MPEPREVVLLPSGAGAQAAPHVAHGMAGEAGAPVPPQAPAQGEQRNTALAGSGQGRKARVPDDTVDSCAGRDGHGEAGD
jgi:hypothetical protein